MGYSVVRDLMDARLDEEILPKEFIFSVWRSHVVIPHNECPRRKQRPFISAVRVLANQKTPKIFITSSRNNPGNRLTVTRMKSLGYLAQSVSVASASGRAQLKFRYPTSNGNV